MSKINYCSELSEDKDEWEEEEEEEEEWDEAEDQCEDEEEWVDNDSSTTAALNFLISTTHCLKIAHASDKNLDINSSSSWDFIL